MLVTNIFSVSYNFPEALYPGLVKFCSERSTLCSSYYYALFLIQFSGENDIILIFTRHPPLVWSQTTLGLFKGLETFLRGMAVLTLLPVCKWKLKLQDTSIAIIGLLSRTVSFIIMGVGRTTSLFFLGMNLSFLAHKSKF